MPGGLPSIGLPDVASSDIKPLLTTAFSIFVVILAQSAATSRAYAAKYGDRFSENTDLVGLGFANIGAGISGTFVVNGSPTKTQMVDSAGGRSQVSALTTVGIVGIVLLFLTKPLQYMPEAVLASVVFLIGIELIDWKGMRRILDVRRDEFVIAAVVAAIVVVVGVEQGVLLAILLSILDHLRRGYRPNDTVVVHRPDGTWHAVPAAQGGEAEPGLVVYRFAASLYFANANHLQEEVRTLASADPPPAWVAIDASAIADVDYTGGETLKSLQAELAADGQRLLLTRVSDDVRAQLDRYGVTAAVGADGILGDDSDALLDLYQQAAPKRPATKG